MTDRMGDEKSPYVLGSTAFLIPRPGQDRARGRAKALPLTQGKEGLLCLESWRMLIVIFLLQIKEKVS